MEESSSEAVPRQPEEPSEDDVLDLMKPCEPYTASELRDYFGNASRWTIQRRLDSLHENGRVRRKKHAENRVTWWVEENQGEATSDGGEEPGAKCPDCRQPFEDTRELLDHDCPER